MQAGTDSSLLDTIKCSIRPAADGKQKTAPHLLSLGERPLGGGRCRRLFGCRPLALRQGRLVIKIAVALVILALALIYSRWCAQVITGF